MFQSKLTVIRGAFIFGPFDPELTFEFCKGVKLERIEIPGKGVEVSSWIAPDDIGRAIVQGIIKKVEGQFFVKSFDASLLDLIYALENHNKSKTEIKHTKSISRPFMKFFKRNESYSRQSHKIMGYLANRPYLVDDRLAQKVLDWGSKWTLDYTTKKALDWFIRYIVASRD